MIKIISPRCPFQRLGSNSILPITASPRMIFFGKKGPQLTFQVTLAWCSKHVCMRIHTVHAMRLHTHSTLWVCKQHSNTCVLEKTHWVADQSSRASLAVSFRSKWAVFLLRLDIIGSGGAHAKGLAWAKLGWMGWKHRFRSEHSLHYFWDTPLPVNIAWYSMWSSFVRLHNRNP